MNYRDGSLQLVEDTSGLERTVDDKNGESTTTGNIYPIGIARENKNIMSRRAIYETTSQEQLLPWILRIGVFIGAFGGLMELIRHYQN